MAGVATLMVSRCPAIINQVKGLSETVPDVQVEVCSVHKASVRGLDADVGLILAHLDPAEETNITSLLWSMAEAKRPCATVIVGDHFSDRQAVALRSAGAADCVAIPRELNRLAFLVNVLTRRHRPISSALCNDLDGYASDREGPARFIEQVRRVAPQDVTLLLTGETGTGKTRLARLIHQMSPRRNEPFLVVDCCSMSSGLVESELFGHARGAFTGADRERAGKLAAAGAGTLLLDEVNSLPPALQGKLLRAVEERVFEPVGSDRSQPVRARLIAASNAPLEREVQVGRFRADLYYRLNVVGFFLPPLRERRASILPLATSFLREFARSGRPDITGFSQDVTDRFLTYRWPGNLRELRNVVNRAVTLSAGPEIQVEDLPTSFWEPELAEEITSAGKTQQVLPGPSSKVPEARPTTLAASKQEVEVRRILEALEKHDNNRLRAAAELGISRVAFYKKLKKLGLMSRRYPREDEPADEED